MSWINIRPDSDFSIHNIPFGIFSNPNTATRRVATAIGDYVADLKALYDLDFFNGLDLEDVFEQDFLNVFIALGKEKTTAVRNRLITVFSDPDYLESKSLSGHYLHPISEVSLHLPIKIGDYTDFFSSREHATNTGLMFRDPANALLPNWLHLPVGYHGRASSIVVSGTDIRRPKGQMLPPEGGSTPVFGSTKRLDFELEVAFIIGKNSELSDSVSTADAESYIFGLCLFNDWSARDIQQWEYVPLGPFLGKNFASTISPWVVTLEALEPFRTKGPIQEPAVLPYLSFDGDKNFDIELEVIIETESGVSKSVCHSNYKYMYWNMAQQLAHHTVNGCNIQIGDLMASGTISGPSPDSFGSMLEISWKGTQPLSMPDGTERRFIQDGDTVIMKAWAEKNGKRVGFGEASGKVLPAI